MTSRAMHLVTAAALTIAALLCVSLVGVSSAFTGHPREAQLQPAAPAVSSQLAVPGGRIARSMGRAPLG